MKEFLKRTFSILMTVIIIFAAAPIGEFAGLRIHSDWFNFSTKALAFEKTGQCGENVFWSFDEDTNVLSIDGYGEIYDFSYNNSPLYQNENIHKVIISQGITYIGKYFFRDCKNIYDIIIPESVENIGYGAFENCSSLKDIVLPDKLSKISGELFYGCSSLETISFSDNIKELGYNSFVFCSSIKTVYFKGEIENWCNLVDEDNRNSIFLSEREHSLYINGELIEQIDLKNIPDIPDCCFKNCTSIKKVSLNNIDRIGAEAFAGCSGLQDISIDGLTKSIGRNCFDETKLYQQFSESTENILYINNYLIKAKDTITGICYVKDDTVLIADEAFYSSDDLYGIVLPDSIKYIGNQSFCACNNLSSVNTPDGLETIGNNAFSGCSALVDFDFPNSILSIGEGAFNSCGLTETNIPESVTVIKSYTFSYCENLRTITLPDTIERINYNAFIGTAYYNNAENWEDGILYIDKYLIDGSNAENDVVVKEGTTLVADYAFNSGGWIGSDGNDSITTVSLPNGLITIGEGAFCSCKKLQSLQFPCSINYVFDYAFAGETLLKEIYLSKSIRKFSIGTIYSREDISVYFSGTEEDWKAVDTDSALVLPASVYNKAKLIFNSNHSFEHNLIKSGVISPSCVSQGYTKYICGYCGYECSDEYTTALGHNFGEWTVAVPASCTENGTETRYCSRCDETETREIKSDGHNYVSVITDPTCTEKGYTTYTCSECGDTYTDNFTDALGHNFGEWAVTVPASCTQTGTETRYCSRCDETETREIPVTEHSYAMLAHKDPSCVQEGETVYKCTECGDSYSVIVPVVPHSLKHIFEDASCTADGEEYDLCMTCGEFFNHKTIPAKGHNYVNGVCTVCGNLRDWEFYVSGGNLTITKYKGTDKNLVIPETLVGYKVTSVADSAFKDCKTLEYVRIPDNVLSVGNDAFRGCSNLKEVYIGEKTGTVGSGAFYDCPKLALICVMNKSVSLKNVFSGNDKRLVIYAYDNSSSAKSASSSGLAVVPFDYPKEKDGKNAIAFFGNTVLYQDLDYNFWGEIVRKYPDTYYLYFDSLTFDGVKEDDFEIDIDDSHIADSKSLTLNEVYIGLNLNGRQLTFRELSELLHHGQLGSQIEFTDNQGHKKNVFEKIGEFFSNVFNALSRAINSIIRIFKRR